MNKKILWLHYIAYFSFKESFMCIIFYLYRNFGIIGLKDRCFIQRNISDFNNFNSVNIYGNLSKKVYIDNFLHINDKYRTKLKKWWYKRKKKRLNLDNPLTFNEKIQWLKLYDSTPLKTLLADKYKVRDYIKNKIGEEHLIPLYGVYDKYEDINFEKLPNKFVIKCNHGSGYNIIIKDKTKLNFEDIKKKLDKWMKRKYAIQALELQYRDIEPKILVEKYMDDGTGDLRDYKVTCFNGRPEFIWMDSDRHTKHKRNLYDLNWKQLPYIMNIHYKTFPSPEKPKHLKKLLKLASILSRGFASVRVDFYIINEKIYFGEMTFSTESGLAEIVPKSFDKRLSSLIKLPKLAYSIDLGEYYILKNPFKTKFFLLFPYYIVVCFLILKILKLNLVFRYFCKIILIFNLIRIFILLWFFY